MYNRQMAFIIGVSEYADPQHNLTYARSDAKAIAKVLKDEFGMGPILSLYDSDATKDNIRGVFEKELHETNIDDGIVIFFAGHGITRPNVIGSDQGYLVPHDGDPEAKPANLHKNIPIKVIRDTYMDTIPAKHIFLIVDSCYGGLALRNIDMRASPEILDQAMIEEYTRSDHVVRQVLTAGSKDQEVLDGGFFNHSIFAGRLIEALLKSDSYITADTLAAYVCEQVARDAKNLDKKQTPQYGYLIGGEGTFVFKRNKESSSDKLQEQSRTVEFTLSGESVTNLSNLLDQLDTLHYRDLKETLDLFEQYQMGDLVDSLAKLDQSQQDI